MTTSDYNAADGCNIVYSEYATVPGCSTNENGQSNSAEHQGYNVYIWTVGELAPEDPSAPAPVALEPYQTVEYNDVFDQIHCSPSFSGSTENFEGARSMCENWTGPDGTSAPGDWVLWSLRAASDIQKFKDQLGNPQLNGCWSSMWMWWGLTDDFDGNGGTQESGIQGHEIKLLKRAFYRPKIPRQGQTCAAEGDWTDLWGNKVNMQEFIDLGLMNTLDNGAESNDPAGHDCIEGHADTLLQDQNCMNNMHYACIPKWKGVDGALAPGTTPGEVSDLVQF